MPRRVDEPVPSDSVPPEPTPDGASATPYGSAKPFTTINPCRPASIGVGVFRAIQHLVVLKDSTIIIAVNTDVDPPIIGTTDFGVVWDAHKVGPQLTEALAARG